MYPTFILRFAIAIILFMHSVPALITGTVISFGRDYLGNNGFGSFGLPLAFSIKLLHLLSVLTLLLNIYLKPTILCNAIILLYGIYLVHWSEGWYVVGGGRNGVEFNFLLLACFATLWISDNKKYK